MILVYLTVAMMISACRRRAALGKVFLSQSIDRVKQGGPSDSRSGAMLFCRRMTCKEGHEPSDFPVTRCRRGELAGLSARLDRLRKRARVAAPAGLSNSRRALWRRTRALRTSTPHHGRPAGKPLAHSLRSRGTACQALEGALGQPRRG